jgi:hypothetical protein
MKFFVKQLEGQKIGMDAQGDPLEDIHENYS